jgi:hypothetical protein
MAKAGEIGPGKKRRGEGSEARRGKRAKAKLKGHAEQGGGWTDGWNIQGTLYLVAHPKLA